MSTPENPTNPYAAPQAVLEEEHGSLQLFGSREALKRVATGLNLVYWGIALFLMCLIAVILLPVFFRLAPIAVIGSLGALAALGFFVSFILGLVGRIFCLSVPVASGARHIIYTAVAFDLITILVAVGQQVISLPEWSSPATSFLSFSATILFIIFLKRVASYIHQPDLAAQAQSLIMMGVFLIVLLLVMGASLALIGAPAALIGLVIFVLVILLVMRYIRLLANLRKEIVNLD